ncbi:MAG TPA: peptide deformylase, partial [Candidatus Saccharimonadales bacterium]|nr:peptide deformylase [Candidatus Saccharimonadales bacterium]
QRSKRVPVVTAEIRRVVQDMIDATIDWEDSRPHEVGVALAAVQIDQPYRIIVVRGDFENKEDKTFNVFINPEIVKLEGELEEDYEGCLSVSDIYGKVPRYSKVRVRALDINGQPIRVKAEGFLARIFQHEVDHTNGLMFVDHLKEHYDAFYKLTDEGKLEPISYEQAVKADIFR